jgi:molybdenum cofactor synthesis domain-containing protein
MTTKMRPIRETIPLHEAQGIVESAVRPIDRTERVGLLEAHGRALARRAVAAADVPPFSRAAMDGYAVRAEDTAGASRSGPRVLRCLQQLFTGQIATHTVGPGQCIEIATGAPMPAGADAVVIVEETDADAGLVRVFTPVSPAQNVGRQGADIQAGQVVLEPGERLGPARIGALAAIGLTEVEVYAQPTVAILSTGNEIVDPGQALGPGQIYDVNRFTVACVVAEHGGIPILARTAMDTLDDLDRALNECLEHDIIVFSGGSSVGERDLMLDAIAARGEVLFHGISVKPGKPTAFGLVAGRPVFGMPGYPSSCLTNAYVLLAPALRRVARLPLATPRVVSMPLAARVVSAAGRHQFYTVRIEKGTAVPAFKASGDITSMSRADGYIEIPAQTDIVEQGELVDVVLFQPT